MTEDKEGIVAVRMLEMRADGCRVGYLVRRSSKRYLLLGFVAVLLAFGGMAAPDFRLFAVFVCGMLFGACLRDVGWFRVIKKQWPFTVKITDWQVVEDLARARAGEKITSESQAE